MAWGDKPNQGPWGRPPGGGDGGGFGPRRGGGGGGNKGAPPDFDEMLRKGQEQLKKLFPGGEDSNKSAIFLVFALLALWLASGIYFVKADEQGVVLRFGEFHRTTPPGVNYRFPYPLESVETPRVTTVNKVEIGFRSSQARARGGDGLGEESLMLTGDENIVDINFEVQWKIGEAAAFLFNVRNPEGTVKTVSESAMREVVGKNPVSTVLSEGEGKLKVEQDTKKLIQDTLDAYKAGIEVVSVNLLKVDPPGAVIDAFRDVQSARADQETARNQAEAYLNDIIPRARGESEKLVLDAEAYKQEVVARAKGEAGRFTSVYNEFKLAKDVTKKRMYLETMEDIMQGMNKLVVDRQGGGVVPYLPLNELKPKAPGEAP